MTKVWECGSFFNFDESFFSGDPWLKAEAILYGSGRDALKALIEHGVMLGWNKLYVPSYYCHEVTESIKGLISIDFYLCNFQSDDLVISLKENEALIAVEYFGRRSKVNVIGGTLILDITHNPCSNWKYDRVANYTFSSLRKVCFLPDGGALWSDNSSSLPIHPPLTDDHDKACNLMLQAMNLKSVYLDSGLIEKSKFLELASRAESLIGQGKYSSISLFSRALLPFFNYIESHKTRQANIAIFKSILVGLESSFYILESSAYLVLVFKMMNSREALRIKLIESNIYPIVLWPQKLYSAESIDIDLSQRVLMIHCDSRYNRDDILIISNVIKKVLG